MKHSGSYAAVCVFGLALCGTGLAAQDLGRYREFEFGSDVAAVSTVTGIAVSELKVIHHRPALIQELTWRPRYGARRPAGPDTEAVEQMVLGFYDDQLFRVTVDYDRERTEGLTDADMIEAISAMYGSQVKPPVSRRRQALSVYEDDLGTPIAQWGSVDHAVAALNRRVRHPGRATEPAIAADAAALKRQAEAASKRRSPPATVGTSHHGPIWFKNCYTVVANDLWLVVPGRVARRPDRR